MKTILLVSAMLVLASWARAGSIPQCQTASLSFYDTSLPNGCLWGEPSESFWSDFSSPMTANPSLITVLPSCFNGIGGPACGFVVAGGTVADIPSFDFQVVLGNGIDSVGAFSVTLCGSGTAEGSATFNTEVVSESVSSVPKERCTSAGNWDFGIGFPSDTVESYAKIDSGSGSVSYFVGVGPEPGTITLVLLGIGLTILAYRHKLRQQG